MKIITAEFELDGYTIFTTANYFEDQDYLDSVDYACDIDFIDDHLNDIIIDCCIDALRDKLHHGELEF